MRYLQPSELIAFNRRLTEDPRIGDEGFGVNLGRLKEATERPQEPRGYDYDLYPTVHDKAAALLDSLLQLHPFSSLNEATAVLGVYTFYRENEHVLDVSDEQLLAYVEAERLPEGYASLAVWFGRHANPIANDPSGA